MADHLFVYFRVAERDAQAALPRWQAWLDTVEEATGVAGTLMRRPEVRDGVVTWMECYHDCLLYTSDAADDLRGV